VTEVSASIGIVVAEFNYDITYLMLQRALSHAKFLNMEVRIVVKVPGTFDSPLAVKNLLRRNDVEGVAVLGAVTKGETKHDELVATQAARKIMDLSVEFGKPVTIGIIGPGASRDQAAERVEEYSVRAVESLAKLIKRYKELESLTEAKGTVFIE